MAEALQRSFRDRAEVCSSGPVGVTSALAFFPELSRGTALQRQSEWGRSFGDEG